MFKGTGLPNGSYCQLKHDMDLGEYNVEMGQDSRYLYPRTGGLAVDKKK